MITHYYFIFRVRSYRHHLVPGDGNLCLDTFPDITEPSGEYQKRSCPS